MKGKIVRKAVLYIIGMFILALGISFSVKSAFGVSPVTSVAFVMARLMSITLGVATIILYVIYVGAQYLLLRKKFPLKYLLQIPVSFIFGYFTDFTTFLISPIHATGYFLRAVCLVVGIMCVALGVKFYLRSEIVPVPGDGIMLAIAQVTKMPVPRTKIIFDCSSAALSIIVSLLVYRDIWGIGIGTIVAALGTGQMLKVFGLLLDKKITLFLDGGHNKSEMKESE